MLRAYKCSNKQRRSRSDLNGKAEIVRSEKCNDEDDDDDDDDGDYI